MARDKRYLTFMFAFIIVNQIRNGMAHVDLFIFNKIYEIIRIN